MKARRFFSLLAVTLALVTGTPGVLKAQRAVNTARNDFYMAPGPSDFPTDTGSRPVGENNAGMNPLGFLEGTPLKFSAALREGYDSNCFTTRTNPTKSFYTNVAAGVSYAFGGPRLQLTTSLGAGATYYYTRPGDKMDYNGQFTLNAVYRLTPKMMISFGTAIAYLAQPDTNIIGGTNRVNGDYIYNNTTLDLAYQWSEKFSTVTGYQIYANRYMEQSLNDTLSFVSQTIKQSARWLLLPKTTVLVEYRANPIYYPGGAGLNSFGNFALVGFDQVFNPRFKWTARLGVEQRFNQNPIDGNSTYFGPYGESNLSYQFGPASTLSWNARYGTEPSGLTNVTQRQTFRTGLNVVHAFTPRITGNLGLGFEMDYFNQQSVINTFSETILDMTAGLNFKINRTVSLSAGYQFVSVYAPKNINFEYTRNVAFAGVNLAF
ncbi:MAG: outer membrane beta-barrel protein [Verrucomicrobiae bacterium]